MEQLWSDIWGTKRSVGTGSVLMINRMLRIVNPTIRVRHYKCRKADEVKSFWLALNIFLN